LGFHLAVSQIIGRLGVAFKQISLGWKIQKIGDGASRVDKLTLTEFNIRLEMVRQTKDLIGNTA